MALSVSLGFFVGLLIGSFVNVVTWRIPQGLSVSQPPSQCPKCSKSISWYDNVPVVSWLVLKGRCRACEARISFRYPAVELATATLFAFTTWRIGTSWEVVAFLYFAGISVALFLIDLDTKTLPDRITLPAYPVSLALLVAASAINNSDAYWSALISALTGALTVGGFYFLIWWFFPRGMGFGDVKLAGLIGMYLGYLGWGAVAVGVMGGFFFGGLYAITLLLVGRAKRKSTLAFGPWMLVGAWFAIFFGNFVWQAYLRLFI